jgi:predicted nuclease of predicted toxin-antitoxin system
LNKRSITDEQVIELALKMDFILLTEDKNFGEWVFAHHIKDSSVLFLRYSRTNSTGTYLSVKESKIRTALLCYYYYQED